MRFVLALAVLLTAAMASAGQTRAANLVAPPRGVSAQLTVNF